MLRIIPHNLHWLPQGPSEQDLCAHGGVSLSVDGTVLLDARDGDYTLSAAALYLLRSLTADHQPNDIPGGQLFPHCGHTMWTQKGSEDVLIMGCDQGLDIRVRHHGEQVDVLLEGGRSISIPVADWRSAVLAFSDAVRAFYESSPPQRLPSDKEDREGFEAFLNEWRRRHDPEVRAA